MEGLLHNCSPIGRSATNVCGMRLFHSIIGDSAVTRPGELRMSYRNGMRFKEVVAMLAIGDGVLATAWPAQHSQLWRFGPRFWTTAMDTFAAHPTLTRTLGAAELAFGLWLAAGVESSERSAI